MPDAGVNTVLLTLGRLPVGLELARGFAAIGWRVIVAEPFRLHLSRHSRSVARCYRTAAPTTHPDQYLADLRRVIDAENVRLVVPVSGESMHVAALHAELPEGVSLFSESQPVMLKLHDKLTFNRLAQQYGLPVPISADSSDGDAARVAQAGGVVVKPRHGCSGRGVTFLPRGASGPFPPGTLVQQRIDGETLSSFSVVRDGVLLSTVVYRAAVLSGSVAAGFERVPEHERIEQWIETFARQSRHTGFLSFDFIVNEYGEPSAIECNPRATSGIHFLHPELLVRAIVDGVTTDRPHRDELRLQETYSCFTATLASVLRPATFRRNFRFLRTARDISWSSDDPWPFLLMMINSWRIVTLAAFRRKTFAEVATLDVEWPGA
ncbi:MAG: ATP-grasp domain-containing protein [Pseudomonadota bacterium]